MVGYEETYLLLSNADGLGLVEGQVLGDRGPILKQGHGLNVTGHAHARSGDDRLDRGAFPHHGPRVRHVFGDLCDFPIQ